MREIKVLILEDDPHKMRMNCFRDRFAEVYKSGQANITYDHVEHAVDCNRMLEQNKYDLILLDHDLGGEEMVGTNHEDCGSRVADFLIANPDIRKRHGIIIVHSLNNVAGPIMAQRLGCKWIPGVFLYDEWHKHVIIN